MRSSIRVKIFAWIAALSLFFVFSSFLFNSLFYKPYYLFRQEKYFVTLCEKMAPLYSGDSSQFQEAMTRAEFQEGFIVSIYDDMSDEPYKTVMDPLMSQQQQPPGGRPSGGGPGGPGMGFPGERMLQRDTPHFPIPDEITSDMEELGENERYVFKEITHLNEIPMLSMFYVIEDGVILLVSRPMESIDISIASTSRFSIITGFFLLLFGTVMAFFLSKYITNPVNELKSIAESMSELDFSRKYTVRTNDEIGELGQSINSLSDQLNEAINRLNRMNSDLLKEIEKERKIDEMRQNFIANVSHELRTPISLIEGYAEGLIDNIADDREKRSDYCQVIMDETRKMEKHVADLLNLSQLQSGVIPLDYSHFDINELIGYIIEKFSQMAQEGTFHWEGAPPLFVRADKSRVEQVISNFIRNALRYGDGNKPIMVFAEKRENGKIRLYVYNSGEGIKGDHLERIWESYYKIDKARTRQLGGSGLGLSIVKAIVDQHQNLCGVENVEGGVRFWFELDG
ncbi:MAG: histidine kinase dimerization/phospho-acceptor domain-containing protein [Spirochaetales bacterium]|nr:histidine kinase dimerization/phospho-acceptor domain-containing protein [Spirochaetales bacterium]